MKPLWYCVSREGLAQLCADEEDAHRNARANDRDWPGQGPHKALRLGPVQKPLAGPEIAAVVGAAMNQRTGSDEADLLLPLIRAVERAHGITG